MDLSSVEKPRKQKASRIIIHFVCTCTCNPTDATFFSLPSHGYLPRYSTVWMATSSVRGPTLGAPDRLQQCRAPTRTSQSTSDTPSAVLQDYDCFYAAVFESEDPSLKSQPCRVHDITLPAHQVRPELTASRTVAVQQKQIIVTCNYEARRRVRPNPKLPVVLLAALLVQLLPNVPC